MGKRIKVEHRTVTVPDGVTPTLVGMERRTSGILVPSEERADAPNGAFDGLALPWMTLDSYGTLFAADAFRDGGIDADPYALLWMHDPWTVAGTLNAEATADGVRIAGVYDPTTDGQAARARAKSGSARGLSVGFERLADAEQEDGSVIITKARLIEVSQVTSRMESVPGAGLAGVRARRAPGGVPGDSSRRSADAAVAAARLRLAGH